MPIPREFAEAGKDAVLWCGSVNIGILLTSSLTMVLCDQCRGRGPAPRSRHLAARHRGSRLRFRLRQRLRMVSGFDHQDVPAVNFIMKPGEAPAGELFWVFYFIATGAARLASVDRHRARLYMLVAGAPRRASPRPITRRSRWSASIGALSTRSGSFFSRRSTWWADHEERLPVDPPLLYIVAWLVLHSADRHQPLDRLSRARRLCGRSSQFGIAATQAAIVFILFMRLKGPPSLKWVFAGAGFFWLLFLYGLSTTDYATRRGWL